MLERNELDESLHYVRQGDTLVVWRLDRLGRSLPDLIATIAVLRGGGLGLRASQRTLIRQRVGKLIFHIFGALAEFKRNLIRERTQAGLTAARARGKTGGRPKKSSLLSN